MFKRASFSRPGLQRFLLLAAAGITIGCATANAIGAAGSQTVSGDDMARRVAPCMQCHGKEGRAAADGYYPRIAGKPAGYLYNQLINFREGRRQQYPLMIYMVQYLSDDYLKEIAGWFAEQHPPYPQPQAADVSAAVMERGRALVMNGDPAKNVPACVSCHGSALTGVKPSIPGLLGLPRDYINSQFGAWRDGARRAVSPDCMGQITARLSLEEINAASAWLASQPVPADPAPAAAPPAKLPIACGSYPQ